MLEHTQGLGQGQQNGSDEIEPLLSPGPSTDNAVKPPLALSHQTRCTWPWIYVVLFCIAIAIVSEIGEYLFLAPRVRLFESVSCTRYYLEHDPSVIQPDGSVPEYLCKVNPVQDEVASVLGWQLFFDSIPAIILPLPFGYLADRYGRRWILFTAMIGYTMTWVSTLFFVTTTMVTTIVADVVPPNLRYDHPFATPSCYKWHRYLVAHKHDCETNTPISESRSTVFFYRFCSELIAECFVPPFTYLLMERGVWIPLLVALSFQILATTMTSLMPETLPVVSPEIESDSLDSPTTSLISPSLNEPTANRTWIQQAKDSFTFDCCNAGFHFLISKFGRQSSTVLFQYVSKRYRWSLSQVRVTGRVFHTSRLTTEQAGLLLSVRAGVNILLFTMILPLIINFVLSNTHAATRDLWIGQVSIVLMTIGVFIVAVAATATLFIIGLVVYTFGTGFPPIIRSLVTFLVESHHESQNSDVARLYAIISVLEGIGSLLAGPGTAWAFRWGLSLGDSWFGLPYLFATILFAVALVTVFSIRLK
ncbi:hypothetical protein RRF57_012514 [Xylaria bambusicola]|uniref:Major facilitator superfamily (MFS) profile domain-containing protein n=1 Tax=Xylaria bambusicola TaxID=326684 RepID=A0AAN7ZAS4_9PEZI